jgi:dTMP kinase
MAEQRQVPLPGLEDLAADAPTQTAPAIGQGDKPGLHVRMFGSSQFFHLWLTQVASAMGDWLGFLAIAALAASISDENAAASVGLVMSARIVPGFFLGPASGVIADRFDRKRVMVTCDLGRAAVLVVLPFVDTLYGLVAASLILECFTLLWTPAKEASVPHLVPPDHLTTANSLSMIAAYGTMPIAAGLFSLLAGLSSIVGLRTNQEGVAFFVDAASFVLSAYMISRLTLPTVERRRTSTKRIDLGQAFHELKEGWSFIFINPVVRAVNIGLAVALIGGGMLVPLGPIFSEEVLNAGPAGFGLFVLALGVGVAIGVVFLSVFQRHIPKPQVFAGSVFVAGISLLIAASTSALEFAALFVAILGVCAGSVYVLGFTLLHESVDDELRGRIFSALYTLVRFCVLIAFAVGPFLSELLDKLSENLAGEDRAVAIAGVTISVPGVRLTLWLAGLIIIGAGILAAVSVRAATAREGEPQAPNPLDELLLQEGAELVSGLTGPITEVRRSRHQEDEPPRSGPLVAAPDPDEDG